MTTNKILNRITCELNMLYTTNPRAHIGLHILVGNLIPSTRQQAKRVVKIGYISVLGKQDIIAIDELMSAQGFKPKFTITKCGIFARLVNQQDFFKALRMKYCF